jgi:outer membrane protein assembly factor BamB
MTRSIASQLRHTGAISLLFALLAACGGGSGGGGASSPAGGSALPAPAPPPAPAPVITAAIASFPGEGYPMLFYDRGHGTLAVVSVTASSGEALSSATVTVNGTVLPYVAELKAYRALIDLALEESVTLNVSSNDVQYSVTARQAPAFPLLASPPIPRSFKPSRVTVDLDRSQATQVSWTGRLPGPEYRYAVGVLDKNNELVWPQRAAFQLVAAGAPNEASLPAGVVPDGHPAIIAGITRSFGIERAASGSSLVVGTFSQTQVTAIPSTSAALASLKILPPQLLSLAPQGEIRLGAIASLAGVGRLDQDFSARVSWTSDAPGVAAVSATGLLTGIAPGHAQITARMGAVSVTRSVTVLARQTSVAAPVPGNAVAFQVDASHAGHATFGRPFVMPAAPTWSVDLQGAISYPLIANGKVYVLSNQQGAGVSYVRLYAFDAQTGKLAWDPVEVETMSPWAALAFERNKLIVINGRGALTAFDADTGVSVWSLPMREAVPNIWSFASSPTALNGIVYVRGTGVGGTLCAVDVDTGALLWSSDYLSTTGAGMPAVSDTSVFVSGRLQHYALDRFSGAQIWRWSGRGFGGGSRTPALFNGKVYLRDPDMPYTRALDQATGAGFGPAVGEPKEESGPSIAAFGGARRFELSQGTLNAIELESNQVAWNFAADGELVLAPIMIDQTVFVGSKTGMVFGIDALTGRELWRAKAGSVINATDEHNTSQPLTGMGAGGGLLAVPAGNVLSVFRLQAK